METFRFVRSFKKYVLLAGFAFFALNFQCHAALSAHTTGIHTKKNTLPADIKFVYNDFSLIDQTKFVYAAAFGSSGENSWWDNQSREFIQAFQKNPKSVFFHAVKQGSKVIAFALCQAASKVRAIYVNWLAVDPSFQKYGLGKRLLKSIFVKHPETQAIILQPTLSAYGFYKHIGFDELLDANKDKADGDLLCVTRFDLKS